MKFCTYESCDKEARKDYGRGIQASGFEVKLISKDKDFLRPWNCYMPLVCHVYIQFHGLSGALLTPPFMAHVMCRDLAPNLS